MTLIQDRKVGAAAVTKSHTPNAQDNVMVVEFAYPVDQGGTLTNPTIDGATGTTIGADTSAGTWMYSRRYRKITPGAGARDVVLNHSVDSLPFLGEIWSYKAVDPDNPIVDAAVQALDSAGTDPMRTHNPPLAADFASAVGHTVRYSMLLSACGTATNGVASNGGTLEAQVGYSNAGPPSYLTGDSAYFMTGFIAGAATVTPGFTRPTDGTDDPSGPAVIGAFGIAIAPPITLEQTHARWRNDDGSETTATWKASEDANMTAPLDTVMRIRLQTKETDA